MSTPTRTKRFRYFLKADAVTYYQVIGGNVTTTTIPTPLISDPMEWKETDLKWSRNAKYHGVFRNFVIPLSFVREAAHILRHICATQEGYESRCILYIEKLNSTSREYEFYYSGDIDFGQKHNTRLYFQAEVLDSGLAAIIKAKEATPYEIPIESTDSLKVLRDGIKLQAANKYAPVGITVTNNTVRETIMPLAFTIQEGAYNIGVAQTQTANEFDATSPLPTLQYDDFAFKATEPLAGYVDGLVELIFTNNTGNTNPTSFRCTAYVIGTAKTVSSFATLYTHSPACPVGSSQTISFSFNKAITLNANDRLFIVIGNTLGNPCTYVITGNVANKPSTYFITLHSTFRLPPTVDENYRYLQVYQKLISKISNGANVGASDFLSNPNLVSVDNKPWNTLVTCGDSIRRLGTTAKPATIRTTLQDLYADAAARWMVGMGIERDIAGNEIVRMEHLSRFYDNSTVAFDIGEIDFSEEAYAQGYIYNLLAIGMGVKDYDRLNGKDEFSTTETFDFPVLRFPGKKWDLVSRYRWDMYGIETVRANSEKKTTDSDSDNDTFLTEVNDNPVTYSLLGGNSISVYTIARKQNNTGNSATGLLFPDSAYNISLSPKRNLLRNAPLIHTALYQQDAKTITFQTTDKNADLQSNLGSGLIVEKADVPVATLAAPLFLPIIFQFVTKVPVNLPALIAANPYGRINFSVRIKGQLVQLGGFIDEVGIKPGDNDVYTWKLLACPDVDLSALVH